MAERSETKKAFVDQSGTFHCSCGATYQRGPVNGEHVFRCLACGHSFKATAVAELRPPPAPAAGAGEGCTCRGCGARYRVDVMVSNDLWLAISGGREMLCPACIGKRIEERGKFDAFKLVSIVAGAGAGEAMGDDKEIRELREFSTHLSGIEDEEGRSWGSGTVGAIASILESKFASLRRQVAELRTNNDMLAAELDWAQNDGKRVSKERDAALAREAEARERVRMATRIIENLLPMAETSIVADEYRTIRTAVSHKDEARAFLADKMDELAKETR